MTKKLIFSLGLSLAALVTLAAMPHSGILSYIVVPARPGNYRNSEATILNLGHHRLMLAWTDFYTSNSRDSAPAQIASMVSKNGGRTWSGKRVLQPNTGKLNVMEANLLRLHDGKIFFVFLRKNSPANCVPFFRVSSDNARTFSPPRAIPVNPDPGYYTINNDRIIQLQSGRILVPLAYTKDSRLDHRLVSTIYYSDNEGKTWKATKTTIDARQSSVGAEEPGVVQLKNGRVMLWFRTNAGHPYQCYSRDGGVTWSAPRPMTVAAPNSPQSIKRIPSTGDLLMVWNNSATQRFPLAAAISRDNGRTWQDIKDLDADAKHTYAYTSITFVNHWAFFTYYSGPAAAEHENVPLWSLKLKRVPIQWFYAKKG